MGSSMRDGLQDRLAVTAMKIHASPRDQTAQQSPDGSQEGGTGLGIRPQQVEGQGGGLENSKACSRKAGEIHSCQDEELAQVWKGLVDKGASRWHWRTRSPGQGGG